MYILVLLNEVEVFAESMSSHHPLHCCIRASKTVVLIFHFYFEVINYVPCNTLSTQTLSPGSALGEWWGPQSIDLSCFGRGANR